MSSRRRGNCEDSEWGAQWLQNTRKIQGMGRLLTQNERRIANMLDWVFKGIYHISEELRTSEWDDNYVRINFYSLGATWDSNVLTRLVVGAHDFSVRLELSPSGPRRMRLDMWARSRNPRISQGHPTLEKALTYMKRPSPWWDEIEVAS